MADLGDLFKHADETARGLAQQAVDFYQHSPVVVWASVAVAAIGYVTRALGWWRTIQYVWRWFFNRKKLDDDKPVKKVEFEELNKKIEVLNAEAQRNNQTLAQLRELVEHLRSALDSKVPEVQRALREFVDDKPDEAYATLTKAAKDRIAANDKEAAIVELLRAASFVSISSPAKAAEAYEKVLKLKPDAYTPHLGLAHYSLATGNGDKALVHAEQAEKYAGNDTERAQARAALINIFLRRGEGDRALAMARDDVKQSRARRDANPTDISANQNLGNALQRLAEVQSTLGDLAGAHQSCRQSYDVRAELASRQPPNGDLQREHFWASVNLAATLASWGDLANALIYADHAEKLSAEVAKANATRSDVLRESLICRNEHGRLLQQSGDLRGALDRFEASMAEFRILADKKDAGLQPSVDLKNAFLLLSEARERAGDLDTALGDARRALEIAVSICAAAPKDRILRGEEINARQWLAGQESRAGNLDTAARECDAALAKALDRNTGLLARDNTVAVLHQVRASIRTQSGDIDNASADYARAIALYETLHQAQPDALALSLQLLNCRIEHAELKAQIGEVADADAILDGCVGAADTLAARHPNVIDTKRTSAWVRYRLGQRMRGGGDANGAVKALTDAMIRYRTLARSDPADMNHAMMSAWAEIALANALTATGNFNDAEAYAGSALGSAQHLTLTDPLNVNTQSLLAAAIETEGYMHGARGRLDDQSHSFERMLKINADLARRNGAGADAERSLATSHLLLGEALVAVGRVPEALQHLTTALDLRTSIVERFARWEDKLQLIRARLSLAAAHDEPKKAEQGLRHVEAAFPIAEELARKLPDVAAVQAQRAAIYHQKGDLLLTLARYREAEAAYQTDLAARRTLLSRDKANADLRERVAGSEACIAECRFLAGDLKSAKPLFAGALASYRAIAEAQTNDHWLAWNILWPTFRLAQIEGNKAGQLEAARMLKGLQDRDGRDRIGRHFGWLNDMRNLFPELG